MHDKMPLATERRNAIVPAQISALPVFYCPEMVAHVESFSPSAAKPAAVVAAWLRTGIPLEIIAPLPLRDDEISLAHKPSYVAGVFSGICHNGFANRDANLATSLRFTNGAMYAAALAAIKNGNVAVAPCSGFHHARYDRAAGFCTFNGLMVTALALKYDNTIKRIGILDFDQHFGDGTADIIEKLGLDWVSHYTAGEYYDSPRQAAAFMRAVPGIVKRMADCDVMLYQAGADPHVDDPLGGWLTTVQLQERDRLAACRA